VISQLHFHPDHVDRKQQWGLQMSVTGFREPFRVCELEPSAPEFRCKGHYPPEPTSIAPTAAVRPQLKARKSRVFPA
jgi:hypothetical protein